MSQTGNEPHSLLGGLSPAQFLSGYWQKKPYLIPGAIPELSPALSPAELAGLACEEGVESRLVLERDGTSPWEVRHGPFAESDFAALPDSHWTLLVQDADKHVPALSALLGRFRFIPDWRIDDLMVSYAAPEGSVGPHLDDYDVFLLQANGTRRWLIGGDAGSSRLPDTDLSILTDIEPDNVWTLHTGDMLYIPPGVPHHGIAEGDDCMTYSIGFRAPSWQEIMTMLFDGFMARTDPRERYSDPGLRAPDHPAQLRGETVAAIKGRVRDLMDFDDQLFTRWLGIWLTEPKEHLAPVPVDKPISGEAVKAKLVQGGVLVCDPSVRLLFVEEGNAPFTLFAGGEVIPPPPGCEELVRTLARHRRIDCRSLMETPETGKSLEFLAELVNRGYLVVSE